MKNTKNPGIETLLDESRIDICKEECLSPERYFLLFFAIAFIVTGYLNVNFFCAKDSLFLVAIKKKNHAEFFYAGILRV